MCIGCLSAEDLAATHCGHVLCGPCFESRDMGCPDDQGRCPLCSHPGVNDKRVPLPAILCNSEDEDGSAAGPSRKRVRVGAALPEHSIEMDLLRDAAALQRSLAAATAEYSSGYSADAQAQLAAFKSLVAEAVAKLARLGDSAARQFADAVALQEKAMEGDVQARMNSADLFDMGRRSGDMPFMHRLTNVGVPPIGLPAMPKLPVVDTLLTVAPIAAAIPLICGNDEHLLEVIGRVKTWEGMMAVYNLMDLTTMPMEQPWAFGDDVARAGYWCLRNLIKDAGDEWTLFGNADFYAYSLAFLILYAKFSENPDDYPICSPESTLRLQKGEFLSIALTSVHASKVEELVLRYAQQYLFIDVEDGDEEADDVDTDDDGDDASLSFDCLVNIMTASRVEHAIESYNDAAFGTLEKLFVKYDHDEYAQYVGDKCLGLVSVYLSPLGVALINTSEVRALAALSRLNAIIGCLFVQDMYSVNLTTGLHTRLFDLVHLMSGSDVLNAALLRDGKASVYAGIHQPLVFLQHYLDLSMDWMSNTVAHQVCALLMNHVLGVTGTELKTPAEIRLIVGRHVNNDDEWEEEATDGEEETDGEDETDGEEEADGEEVAQADNDSDIDASDVDA